MAMHIAQLLGFVSLIFLYQIPGVEALPTSPRRSQLTGRQNNKVGYRARDIDDSPFSAIVAFGDSYTDNGGLSSSA